MTMLKRISALAILLAVAVTSFAAPALAAVDWRAQFAAALSESTGYKRAAALADITADGLPELAVASVDSAGETALKVYAYGSSSIAPLNLDVGFAMSGVKKLAMQWRKVSDGGAPILDVTMSSAAEARRVALKYGGSGNLKTVFSASKAKVDGAMRYTIDGAPVSASKFSAALKAYESASKKAAQLPLAVINKGDGKGTIQTKFDALVKKHASYGFAKAVTLSAAKAELNTGETLALKAKVAPATAFTDTVQWITENERIATVSDAGVVKGVASGTVKIYARSSSGTAQKYCTVKVLGPKATNVLLDQTSLSLIKGGSAELEVSFQPLDANPSVKWTTSNAAVAAVNQKGQVLGVSKGSATITVTTDNGLKASCTVAVSTRPAVVVDISQHEYSASMDWAKIAKSVDLMILRCGVTRTETAPIGVGKDAKFAYFAEQCKKYGIPFGVYFYGKCSDAETAKKEAKMTWDTASPYKPLFYVYDVEESRLTKAVIETYIATLKKLGAKKTGYYVAHHLYAKYKLDTGLVDFIWIPHYGKNDGTVNSAPSYACDMHQYTSVGKIDGIPGGVDVSRLMGDKTLAWYLKR